MKFVLSLIVVEIIGIAVVILMTNRSKHSYTKIELFSVSFFIGTGFIVYQFMISYLLNISFNLVHMLIVPFVLVLLVFMRYCLHPKELLGDLIIISRTSYH